MKKILLLLIIMTAMLASTMAQVNNYNNSRKEPSGEELQPDDTIPGEQRYQQWKQKRDMEELSREKKLSDERDKRKKQIRDTLANAEYIFEGKTIRLTSYRRDNKINVESRIVKISKVIKGNLKIGTCEIVTPLSEGIVAGDTRDPYAPRDTFGIFVCRKAVEFPFDPRYNIDKVDNKEILTQGHKMCSILFTDRLILGPDTLFRNKIAAYRFLKHYGNIKNIAVSGRELQDSTRQEEIYGDKLDNRNEGMEYNKEQEKLERDSIDTLMYHQLVKKKVTPGVDTTGSVLPRGKKADDAMRGDSTSVLKTSMLKNTTEEDPNNYLSLSMFSPFNFKLEYIDQTFTINCIRNTTAACSDPELVSVTSDNSIIEYSFKYDNPTYINTGFEVNGVGVANLTFEVRWEIPSAWDKFGAVTACTYITRYATIQVNVTPAYKVKKIKLDPSIMTVMAGQYKTITATAISENTSYPPTIEGIEWSISSDDAEISNSGNSYADIRAIEYDIPPVIVTATSLDHSNGTVFARCTVIVSPCPLTGVSLNISNTTRLCKSKVLLVPTYESIYASIETTSYTSSNSSVATVSSDGLVTCGTVVGSTVITFSATDYFGTTKIAKCIVYTKPVIESIAVSGNTAINGSRNIAGVKNLLTITGAGFGTTKGAIQFTSADASSGTLDDIDVADFIYWDNIKIQYYLPSRALNDAILERPNTTIGTGNITVITSNSRISNSKWLDIPYSITQFIKNTGAIKYRYETPDYVKSDNTRGNGIRFKINSSITLDVNSSQMMNVIKRVLYDWGCKLNVNITIDDNALNYITIDAVDPKFADALMLTDYLGTETLDGDFFHYQYRGITINQAKLSSFDYSLPGGNMPAGMYSFYTCLLHEVGHVLGQSHVNNTQDLMYFQGNTDSPVKKHETYTNTIAGAWYVTNYSVTKGLLSRPLSPPGAQPCIPPLSPTMWGNAFSPWDVRLYWMSTYSDVDDYNPPGFVVERLNGDGVTYTEVKRTNPGDVTTYTDGNLTQLTTYKYRVKAWNTMGESGYVYLQVKTQAETTPPAPGLPLDQQSSSSYFEYKNIIRWQANTSQTTGYIVYRSRTYDGVYTEIGRVQGTNTTRFDDFSKGSSTTYFYKVVAYNNYYTSLPSPVIVVIPAYCNNQTTIRYSSSSSVPDQTYATNTVQASTACRIADYRTVVFQAGQRVELRPGFSTSNGCYFHASTRYCSGMKSAVETDSAFMIQTGMQSQGDMPNGDEISVYPNPTEGKLMVVVKEHDATVTVVSMNGVVLKNEKVTDGRSSINLDGLSPSSYIVKIHTASGKNEVFMVIKK